MPVEFKILLAVTIVIMIAVPLIIIFAFWLPNYKSIIKRAKKIDPSVKTFADAQFVLQKNIMESVGQNKNDDNPGSENENKKS